MSHILMIPGPVDVDEAVLGKMGLPLTPPLRPRMGKNL